ncbi:MAG: pyruvate formate-lyase-activating protein [Eubacteriales bacterium]
MSDSLQVSSFLSMSGCDGPSLRSVIFLYGCPLRCDYCHNPETWTGEEFETHSVDSLLKKVLRYRSYYKNGGGVTISGGEPLLQQNTVVSLLKQLKENEIHTCIDTCGAITPSEDLLALTDLFLLDVKFLSQSEYITHTKTDIFEQVICFLELCQSHEKPIWVRHVLYPDLTDHEDYVSKLLALLSPYSNVERVELLPFRSLCTTKYQELSLPFPMEGVTESDPERVETLKGLVSRAFP